MKLLKFSILSSIPIAEIGVVFRHPKQFVKAAFWMVPLMPFKNHLNEYKTLSTHKEYLQSIFASQIITFLAYSGDWWWGTF